MTSPGALLGSRCAPHWGLRGDAHLGPLPPLATCPVSSGHLGASASRGRQGWCSGSAAAGEGRDKPRGATPGDCITLSVPAASRSAAQGSEAQPPWTPWPPPLPQPQSPVQDLCCPQGPGEPIPGGSHGAGAGSQRVSDLALTLHQGRALTLGKLAPLFTLVTLSPSPALPGPLPARFWSGQPTGHWRRDSAGVPGGEKALHSSVLWRAASAQAPHGRLDSHAPVCSQCPPWAHRGHLIRKEALAFGHAQPGGQWSLQGQVSGQATPHSAPASAAHLPALSCRAAPLPGGRPLPGPPAPRSPTLETSSGAVPTTATAPGPFPHHAMTPPIESLLAEPGPVFSFRVCRGGGQVWPVSGLAAGLQSSPEAAIARAHSQSRRPRAPRPVAGP